MAVPAFVEATSVRLRMTRLFTTFPCQAEVDIFPEVRQLVADFLKEEAGFAKRHWPKLIRRSYPELQEESLENMLVKLVVRTYLIRTQLRNTSPARLHQFVEYCSGQGMLTLE